MLRCNKTRPEVGLRILCIFMSLVFIGPVLAGGPDAREQASRQTWDQQLKPEIYGDREIHEGAKNNVIEINAPFRAEDAADVPLTVRSLIPNNEDRYIREVKIYIDRNPVPWVGTFNFTPKSGRADLAMRVRVDDFTYIRAIAETSDGELYMAQTYIRSMGGCSAPPGAAAEESRELMGQMRLRTFGEIKFGEPNLAQLQIRHPNITGLAIDQRTRVRPPAHYVRHIKVDYEGKTVMTADLTFAISLDPTFRFFFVPDQQGEFTVTAVDTRDQTWEQSIPLAPDQA